MARLVFVCKRVSFHLFEYKRRKTTRIVFNLKSDIEEAVAASSSSTAAILPLSKSNMKTPIVSKGHDIEREGATRRPCALNKRKEERGEPPSLESQLKADRIATLHPPLCSTRTLQMSSFWPNCAQHTSYSPDLSTYSDLAEGRRSKILKYSIVS